MIRKRWSNGGIDYNVFGIFTVDQRSVLRCGTECTARVIRKQWCGDVGFGDSPMFIEYEFATDNGAAIVGRFESMDTSFTQLEVGDDILVRYDPENPNLNTPRGALLIVDPVSKKAD